MDVITKVRVQKDHMIVRKKDAVMRWFIVLEGSVIQRNSYAKIMLGKNAVIGISEIGRYLCDYVAAEDSVLAVFSYSAPADLKAVIHGNAGMRGILLRAAIGQRQQLLKSYAVFQQLVRQFHLFVESEYNSYMALCAQYGLQANGFAGMERFQPLEMVHRAENWEISNSISLMHYMEEYLQLMQKDDDLCIGAIMEACYQSRRVMQGTIEMVNYLAYNKGILLSESEHDIFHRYLKLFVIVRKKAGDGTAIAEHIGRIAEVARKLNVYDEKLVAMGMAVCRKISAAEKAAVAGGGSEHAGEGQNRVNQGAAVQAEMTGAGDSAGEMTGARDSVGESARADGMTGAGDSAGEMTGAGDSVGEGVRADEMAGVAGHADRMADVAVRAGSREALSVSDDQEGASAFPVPDDQNGTRDSSVPEGQEGAQSPLDHSAASPAAGELEMPTDHSTAGLTAGGQEMPGEADGLSEQTDDSLAVGETETPGELLRQENCLQLILDYAGFSEQEKKTAEDAVARYQGLSDVFSADKEVHALRRELIKIFYDAYYRVFMRTMEDEISPEPVIRMFLNFGFMDAQLAGEENTTLLSGLVEHLDVCRSEHVYTMYEWLKCIYNGEKQPSKNEFDLDYPAYLADLRKNGKITADQERRHLYNQEYKVRYELQNMFASGNRATYGKMSAFCPILGEYDLINSPEKMLVTAQRLEEAIDKIRQIDFSVFYREVQFSDPAKGINREMIMKEVMPDVILMPNAGTRAMMWQETVGVKKDTPARFLFPVMTVADIDDLMMETMGRFRWEICRKIQGVHWNDIRERSLTSEYCDYLQFYRKNNEISPEVKEKIRNALVRGRNNFREVFVKDYQNWIKYESRGSYRLNKVARSILIRYCPFARSIRAELKSNPMYQSELERYDILKAKTVQRIQNVYDRYQKSGGEITKELEDNLDYYDL